MSYAKDLLAQARLLATKEPQKPKRASINRAISTAYYAAFHKIVEGSITILFKGSNDFEASRAFAARCFDHREIYKVCAQYPNLAQGGQNSSKLSKLITEFSFEIEQLAQSFISLQELRHRADYDYNVVFSRENALMASNQAKHLITRWDLVKVENPKALIQFATAILLNKSYKG